MRDGGYGTEQDEEFERLLIDEVRRPGPDPSPDLIARTLKRVQNLVLVGDLLRLATLELLWKSNDGDRNHAVEPEERQD